MDQHKRKYTINTLTTAGEATKSAEILGITLSTPYRHDSDNIPGYVIQSATGKLSFIPEVLLNQFLKLNIPTKEES